MQKEFIVKKVTFEDGREGVPAKERVRYAAEMGIDYDFLDIVHTEIWGGAGVRCKATLQIRKPQGLRTYFGTSSMRYNPAKDNFADETTETKAVGRAFANAGILIDENYASADELADLTMKIEPAPEPELVKKGEEAVAAVEKVVERTRSKKPRNEQQIATPEIEKEPALDQGAPPVIAESSAQELEESPEQPEPAVQQVQEKEQEKQPEKVEEKPAAKKPAAKPDESGVLTSNPFGIKVSEIPAPTEAKPNPQRPFQDWYSIFVDVGANKNQKATDEFEELAGLVINSVAELIPYSDYTSLFEKAPASVVHLFLTRLHEAQNS